MITTVEELIKELQTQPPKSIIDISVDVSTGEKDYDSRVFTEEIFHVQQNNKDSSTLLCRGYWNKDI